jgi:integrase
LILDEDGLPSLNAVSRCDEFFGNVRVKKIDGDLLNKFVTHLREHGYSNGSINRSLSKLRAMLNYAKEQGKVWRIPEKFPMLPEQDAIRKGFFTLEEYRRLLPALPPHLRPLLAIGYATGMRVSEIRGLKWSQVDFLNRLIALDPGTTKNNEGRFAPITDELDVTLRAHRRECPKGFPWVCWFLDAKGNPQRVGTFDVAWNNACVKVDLGEFETVTDATGAVVYDRPRTARSKAKPKRRYVGRLFHDLRRSAVKNLVDSGVPERVAMTVSGHKTRSVFDRYHIVNRADVLEAGRRLNRFVAAQENGPRTAPAEGGSDGAKPSVN